MTRVKTAKHTNLFDHYGNANEIRAIIRVAVWGIVEKIRLLDDSLLVENELIDTDSVVVDDVEDCVAAVQSADLPIQFTSKKKIKHYQKKNSNNSNNNSRKIHDKIFANEKFVLPKPKLNETMLESNVLKSCVTSDGVCQVVYVRILGVSCNLPSGAFVVARIIGHDDGDKSGNAMDAEVMKSRFSISNVLEIHRERLNSLKVTELHRAHLMVKDDETYLSNKDAPSEVHLKYWNQRYRLLSLYDRGVRLDAESWYSITPESIAHHVTNVCLGRACERGISIDVVMECFSGCGGNTIPFAMKGKRVIAVDFDAVKLDHLM